MQSRLHACHTKGTGLIMEGTTVEGLHTDDFLDLDPGVRPEVFISGRQDLHVLLRLIEKEVGAFLRPSIFWHVYIPIGYCLGH